MVDVRAFSTLLAHPDSLIEAKVSQGRPRPFSAQAVIGPCFSTGQTGQHCLAPPPFPPRSGGWVVGVADGPP